MPSHDRSHLPSAEKSRLLILVVCLMGVEAMALKAGSTGALCQAEGGCVTLSAMPLVGAGRIKCRACGSGLSLDPIFALASGPAIHLCQPPDAEAEAGAGAEEAGRQTRHAPAQTFCARKQAQTFNIVVALVGEHEVEAVLAQRLFALLYPSVSIVFFLLQ